MLVRKHSKDKLIHCSFWNLLIMWISKGNMRDCCCYPNREAIESHSRVEIIQKMLNILTDLKRYFH